MNDAFVDSDSDDEDFVVDSGAESDSDSDISDDGEEDLSGNEEVCLLNDKQLVKDKKEHVIYLIAFTFGIGSF